MSPIVASWLLAVVSSVAADVLVVCPEALRAPLGPWIEHRTGQGHTIEVLSSKGSAEAIRSRIRQHAKLGETRFLLLVGDATADTGDRAMPDLAPAHLLQAKVNVRFGSDPWIATDNWYADLDDDHLPELAVGRLTADTPAELSTMVAKILSYENAAGGGDWRRRISFVAGLGGFGTLTDSVLESCTKKFITEGVPGGYSTSMTYANWRSPYCPHPSEFKQTILDRLNEGCLFWVYMGHGHVRGLDHFAVPGAVYSLLESRDVPRLQCRQGAPIAFFLSCHTGAYDAAQDCLAEEMLRSPGGPVAVLCGSRMTMPYAMAVLGVEALKECFERRRGTVGEVLMHAKRNTMLAPRTGELNKMLDLLAGLLNAPGDLADERLEHVHLFNLLGDPLLRIPQPHVVKLDAAAQAPSGGTLSIAGHSPLDGPCLVELVVRRDRMTFPPPRRAEFDHHPSARQLYREVYRRANDIRLAAVRTEVVDGRLQLELPLPRDVRGDCQIRVFVERDADFALGQHDVHISAAGQAE